MAEALWQGPSSPKLRMKTVLFVDNQAGLSDEDRQRLELLGYVVVAVDGDPSRVLHTQTIYQPEAQ